MIQLCYLDADIDIEYYVLLESVTINTMLVLILQMQLSTIKRI